MSLCCFFFLSFLFFFRMAGVSGSSCLGSSTFLRVFLQVCVSSLVCKSASLSFDPFLFLAGTSPVDFEVFCDADLVFFDCEVSSLSSPQLCEASFSADLPAFCFLTVWRLPRPVSPLPPLPRPRPLPLLRPLSGFMFSWSFLVT